MDNLPATMELPLHIMFSACLWPGRYKSGGGDSVIWWITDKSLGNHGRLTTLKPFIDFSMLPFSDERDIFNGLWLLLSEDHGLLVGGGFEGHCWWKKRPPFSSSPHFYLIFIVPALVCVSCVFVSACGLIDVRHSNLLTPKVWVKTIDNFRKIRWECWFAAPNTEAEYHQSGTV